MENEEYIKKALKIARDDAIKDPSYVFSSFDLLRILKNIYPQNDFSEFHIILNKFLHILEKREILTKIGTEYIFKDVNHPHLLSLVGIKENKINKFIKNYRDPIKEIIVGLFIAVAGGFLVFKISQSPEIEKPKQLSHTNDGDKDTTKTITINTESDSIHKNKKQEQNDRYELLIYYNEDFMNEAVNCRKSLSDLKKLKIKMVSFSVNEHKKDNPSIRFFYKDATLKNLIDQICRRLPKGFDHQIDEDIDTKFRIEVN